MGFVVVLDGVADQVGEQFGDLGAIAGHLGQGPRNTKLDVVLGAGNFQGVGDLLHQLNANLPADAAAPLDPGEKNAAGN